ncbi:hypothetical protein H0H93_007981 [Arthromyces matolae]|nr:hypothetical protein H0H93_007981 [Arthromyces matolae]
MSQQRLRAWSDVRILYVTSTANGIHGFEAGLRRAQEEADYHDVGMSGRPTTQARVDEQFQVTAIRNDIDLDAISSPIHQRTPRARRQSLPRRPSPPPREPTVESPSTESDYHVVEDAPQSYLHPPQPPNIARSASPGPSIVRYAVDIPSAAQIEQNQSIGKSTQPWVTAHEYHRITGTQPSPENNFHANFGDRPRGVSFVTSSGNPGKKKESWLRRTLSKPWRKSRTVQEAPISWYQTTQQHPETSQPSESSVHVRDFGGTEPSQGRPSLDAASVSTRVSQLEIVNPPSNPTAPSYKSASERSFGSGANKGKKKARDRYSMLRVINEDDDPAAGPSMATTARHSSAPTPVSPSMGQIKALLSDTASNYSNPKVLDDWRRSSASGAGASAVLSMNAGAGPRSASASASVPASQRQTGPPRRRPVHLSVPAPLASPSHDPPSSSTMPATTASSSQPSASEFLGVNPQDFRPGLQRSVTSGTVYGITVEPPSRSPTEAPNSARPPQGHFLSPEHTYVPNLPILTPSPQTVGQPHGREYTAPPSIRQQPSRPGSVASSRPPPAPLPKSPQHLPSYSLPPSHRPPSQSQQHAGPDRTHRASAASSTMPMSMPRNSAPQPLADNASRQ